jgi:molybdopterin converting factor subunit 1
MLLKEYQVRLVLRFFAGLRDIAGQSQMQLEVPEGTTVGRLQDLLWARYPQTASMASPVLIAVNHEYANPATQLQDGDEIAFLPPFGGGQHV